MEWGHKVLLYQVLRIYVVNRNSRTYAILCRTPKFHIAFFGVWASQPYVFAVDYEMKSDTWSLEQIQWLVNNATDMCPLLFVHHWLNYGLQWVGIWTRQSVTFTVYCPLWFRILNCSLCLCCCQTLPNQHLAKCRHQSSLNRKMGQKST